MKNGFQKLANVHCAWLLLVVNTDAVNAATLWEFHQENDRTTNRSFSFAHSPTPRLDLYDDIRLDIVCKDNVLQAVIDSDVLIASQGSLFDVEYQINKHPPVHLKFKVFPDTKRRGFNQELAKPLADALLSGETVFLRVNTMIGRVLTSEMTLAGATKPIQQVYQACGLAAGQAMPSYSIQQFNEDFAKLSPEQQQDVLSKLYRLIKHYP